MSGRNQNQTRLETAARLYESMIDHACLHERILCQAAVYSQLADGLLSVQRRRTLLELPPNRRGRQLLFPIVQARDRQEQIVFACVLEPGLNLRYLTDLRKNPVERSASMRSKYSHDDRGTPQDLCASAGGVRG